MKKYILFVLLSIVACGDLFADGYPITRSWCGGIFHRRFVAVAKTSVFSTVTYQTGYNCIGQWVGTNPRGSWSNVCNNDNKGCSRPQVATCGTNTGTVSDMIYSGCYLTFSGSHPYSAYAKAEHLVGGFKLTKNASGRGSAGQVGEFELDELVFQQLNDNGSSIGEITGDIYINSNNQLVISALKGQMKITAGADYYSSLKVIVIKENTAISNQDAEQNEEQAINGTYQDIVYTTELKIDRNGVTNTGALGDQPQTIQNFSANGFNGVALGGVSVTVPMNTSLEDDEALSIITILDGGFDISSAVISNKATSVPVATQAKQYEVAVYPNPASQTVALKFFSYEDNALVQVACYDVTGKLVKELYTGKAVRGNNNITDIDVSTLPRGYHFLKLTNGKVTVTKSLVLE